MALRFDSAPITSWEKLWDGRLRVKATFSKVGPLAYVKPDGSTQVEIVSAAELFREDSLDTAATAAVTLNHPPGGIVSPKTWKKYNVGASGSKVEARTDAGLVDIVYVIGDEEAIEAVESGDVSEVSVGYQVALEQREDGLYQTNRQYNHHALVPKGRAGATVRLHYDAADPSFRIDAAEDVAWLCDADMGGESPVPDDETTQEKNDGCDCGGSPMTTTDMKGKGPKMTTYKDMPMSEDAMAAMKDLEAQVDGMGKKGGKMTTYKGFEMSEDAMKAFKGLEAQVEGQRKDAETTLEAERDMLKARVDSLTAELSDRLDEAAVESLAQAKLDAYTNALPYLPSDTRFDAALAPTEWKRQAIASASPELKLDGKDDGYITAAFDVLQTTSTRRDTFREAAGTAATAPRQASLHNDADPDFDEAQYRKDMADATAAYCWKEDN